MWTSIAELGVEVRRERARLAAYSDESSPSLKEMDVKVEAVERALAYLREEVHGVNEFE